MGVMRAAEARAWYAARRLRPGEALVGWRVCGAPPAGHELARPTLELALQTAALLLADPCCAAVWVCDGRRFYDAAAITHLAGRGGCALEEPEGR